MKLMAVYVIILSIVLVTTHISSNHDILAYSQDSISITCGPTQQSNLSVSMSVDEFIPKSFIHYKFIRPDNSVVYGGFSSGSYGKNTVAINVGPDTGSYLLYIYKDTKFSGREQHPVYSSTITLPCLGNHFAVEYYKNHPRLIEYLLGIRSIYKTIKIGDYLVTSPTPQLFTAELNAINGGASNCVGEAMFSANTLLKSQNYHGPANLLKTSMNQDLNSKMLSLKDRLETYNHLGCDT